ncbi:MAG: type II secretion system protein GspJ [Armatimonadota bacterium]
MLGRSRSGYTLLEFLVAMVIAGTITPGVILALRAGTVALERAEARAARLQEVRAVFDALSRDIRYATLSPAVSPTQTSTTDATTGATTQTGTELPMAWFVGTDDTSGNLSVDSLEIITRSGRISYAEAASDNPPDVSLEPPGDLVQVAYALEPSERGNTFRLIRQRRRPPSPDGDRSDLLVEEVVAEGLSGLDFSYYDGTDWLDSWDTTLDTEAGLPWAVRITIVFEDANGRDVYTTTVPVYEAEQTTTTTTAQTSSLGAG